MTILNGAYISNLLFFNIIKYTVQLTFSSSLSPLSSSLLFLFGLLVNVNLYLLVTFLLLSSFLLGNCELFEIGNPLWSSLLLSLLTRSIDIEKEGYAERGARNQQEGRTLDRPFHRKVSPILPSIDSPRAALSTRGQSSCSKAGGRMPTSDQFAWETFYKLGFLSIQG